MLTFPNERPPIFNPPDFGDVPYPRVKFVLVMPDSPRHELAVLHSVPCDDLPGIGRPFPHGIAEIAYSTTFDEIAELAYARFDEDGWCSCHVCGG